MTVYPAARLLTWRSLALVLVTVSVLLNVAHAGFDTWLIQTLVRAADRPVFTESPCSVAGKR